MVFNWNHDKSSTSFFHGVQLIVINSSHFIKKSMVCVPHKTWTKTESKLGSWDLRLSSKWVPAGFMRFSIVSNIHHMVVKSICLKQKKNSLYFDETRFLISSKCDITLKTTMLPHMGGSIVMGDPLYRSLAGLQRKILSGWWLWEPPNIAGSMRGFPWPSNQFRGTPY